MDKWIQQYIPVVWYVSTRFWLRGVEWATGDTYQVQTVQYLNATARQGTISVLIKTKPGSRLHNTPTYEILPGAFRARARLIDVPWYLTKSRSFSKLTMVWVLTIDQVDRPHSNELLLLIGVKQNLLRHKNTKKNERGAGGRVKRGIVGFFLFLVGANSGAGPPDKTAWTVILQYVKGSRSIGPHPRWLRMYARLVPLAAWMTR